MLRPTRKVGWLPNKVVASNQKGRLAPRQGSTQQKLCFTFISITPESGGGSPILVTVGRPRRFTRHSREIKALLPNMITLADGLKELSRILMNQKRRGLDRGPRINKRSHDKLFLFSSWNYHQMVNG